MENHDQKNNAGLKLENFPNLKREKHFPKMYFPFCDEVFPKTKAVLNSFQTMHFTSLLAKFGTANYCSLWARQLTFDPM